MLLPPQIRQDTFHPAVRGLWQVVQYLVDATCWYLDKFQKQTAGTVLEEMPKTLPFYTTIDVKIERDMRRPTRGGVFNLTVDADYIVPDRFRRSYKLWAGVDEETHVYRFEMPILLLGDIGVGVPAWDAVHKQFLDGELRIAAIEISNQSAEPGEAHRAVYWKPAPDADRVHWVTFDRVLVPG
jgi:hypothetical protein